MPEIDLDLSRTNIEALSCVEQISKLLLDHRTQQMHVFNYDSSLFQILGSRHRQLSGEIIDQLCMGNNHSVLVKYFEVINKYFIDKAKETDKAFYFILDVSLLKDEATHLALKLKILPYLYTHDKKLLMTLCVFQASQYTGKPKLKLRNISNDQYFVYSNATGRFVEEDRTVLTEIELAILRRSGLGDKEQSIAEALNLSLANLKRCKTNMFDKLKVRSISEAIFVAYKQGFL